MAASTTAAAELRSNDGASLTPVTKVEGPSLVFDFPGLEVGVAEYAQGPTGCTVLHFPKGASAAVDARGGATGTIFTDQLREGDGFLHALCFAGGSLYGLEAAAGVSAELFERREYATGWNDIALVSGAVIFDWTPRKNSVYPDKALGRAALRAAKAGSFPLGRRGAGCSATVGKWLKEPYQWEHAGQGGAIRQIGEKVKVAVFTVVNAMGSIVDRQGKAVRGHLNGKTGRRVRVTEVPPVRAEPPKGNTTLTAVVTNQKMSPRTLRQLGRQVHSSMSRAIEPFHTPVDGDVLFALTTNEVDNAEVNEFVLAEVASEVAWDAVLASCEGGGS